MASEGTSAQPILTGPKSRVLERGASQMRRPWVLGVTGASGVWYALRVLAALLEAGESVDLIVSRAARLTILDETGIRLRDRTWREDLDRLASFFCERTDLSSADLRYWQPGNLAAGPSSGTYQARGMIVVPATSACVAGIAVGLSKDLIQRAAVVTLKERRRLIVVLRETPLTRVMLQQLITLDEEGAVILPASPAFYKGYGSVRSLVDSVVGKVLDIAEIERLDHLRWSGQLGEFTGLGITSEEAMSRDIEVGDARRGG